MTFSFGSATMVFLEVQAARNYTGPAGVAKYDSTASEGRYNSSETERIDAKNGRVEACRKP
jgi:hypothetical protein